MWNHPANKGSRIAKLVENVRFQASGRVLHRRSVARIGSHSSFWADVRYFSASRAVIGNPPDWREMSVWGRFLKAGDLFVDVGANVGIYTLWALDHGARVIAAEPLPAHVVLLRENLALNGYQAEVVQAAIASQPGRLLLTTDRGGANRLIEEAGHDRVIEVDVTTLDDVTRGERVDALKIDVEGAERHVLLGAQRVLEDVALIQLEWNETSLANFGETREPVASLLRDAGFVLCQPTDRGQLVPIDVRALQYGPDIFAVSTRRSDARRLLVE